jgi:hypothetical protein
MASQPVDNNGSAPIRRQSDIAYPHPAVSRARAPWRGALVPLIIAASVLSICLILLGLTGDFLVDWLVFHDRILRRLLEAPGSPPPCLPRATAR